MRDINLGWLQSGPADTHAFKPGPAWRLNNFF
jgi:hypothetical protein